MRCRFDQGAEVALREDHPALGLKAGARGTVWARYDREPPAYEVTFRDGDGRAFDVLMDEDEVERAEPDTGAQGISASAVRGRRA